MSVGTMVGQIVDKVTRFKAKAGNMTYDQYYNSRIIRKYISDLDWNNLPLFSYIEIETFSKCNNDCAFCPVNRNADPREHKKMEEDLFHKIIDELADINYTGKLGLYSNNEPFLDTRIEEFAKYARAKLPGAYIFIYTNGTVLTKERFLNIIDSLDYLMIDNYSDNNELSNPAKVIKELAEENPEYGKKVRIDMRLKTEVLTTRGGTAPNKKEIKCLKCSCANPFMQLIIRPDGKISLCCNDAIGRETLGDCSNDTLKNIWYSDKYQQVRKAISKGRKNHFICQNCDMVATPDFIRDKFI